MVVFPPCKINLGLNILRKRSDGYHDIESVFLQVPLNDVLEAVPNTDPGASGMNLHISGLQIPGENKDNILNKIWLALSEIRNLPALHVFLHKVIPFGAGLGGGSSDAAWLVRLLNQLLNLGLTHREMHDTALSAGSDCPFFLFDQPCLIQGRGEIITPIEFSLKGKHLMLAFPEIHISTSEAYANVKVSERNIDIPGILSQPVHEWKNQLVNDFEASVFPKYTQLQEIKDMLYKNGALYASMSGSGSTLYGIFENEPPALPGKIKTLCVGT